MQSSVDMIDHLLMLDIISRYFLFFYVAVSLTFKLLFVHLTSIYQFAEKNMLEIYFFPINIFLGVCSLC